MRWRLFNMPFGFSQETSFPNMIPDGIGVDVIINSALASIYDYFYYYPQTTVFNKEHFDEKSCDTSIYDVTEDLISGIGATYDLNGNALEISRKICDEIAPCYDALKDMFYASSIYNGTFKPSDGSNSYNMYISWISKDSFVLIEENQGVSLEGIELNYPFLKDISLLGIGY